MVDAALDKREEFGTQELSSADLGTWLGHGKNAIFGAPKIVNPC